MMRGRSIRRDSDGRDGDRAALRNEVEGVFVPSLKRSGQKLLGVGPGRCVVIAPHGLAPLDAFRKAIPSPLEILARASPQRERRDRIGGYLLDEE